MRSKFFQSGHFFSKNAEFAKFLRNSSVNDPEAKFFLCQKSIVVAKLTATSISEQKKFYSDLVINTFTANDVHVRHFSQILPKTDVVRGNPVYGYTIFFAKLLHFWTLCERSKLFYFDSKIQIRKKFQRFRS